MVAHVSADRPAAQPTRKQRKRIKQAIATVRQRGDEAIISNTVSPEARTHGDYVVATLPGPTIVTKGREQLTRSQVVKNRGGTAIDRWHARGDLDGDALNAVQAYQSAWHLFLGMPRVTANWSLAGGSGGAGGVEERNIVAKLQAKELLQYLDDEVFFGKPLGYFDLWQNVVIHDEPAGVAGGRLGFRNDGAEAAAKAIVLMLAGEIAIALQARRRRSPKRSD
jgi:hypothetical protein